MAEAMSAIFYSWKLQLFADLNVFCTVLSLSLIWGMLTTSQFIIFIIFPCVVSKPKD
jgi:hypothetical protein